MISGTVRGNEFGPPEPGCGSVGYIPRGPDGKDSKLRLADVARMWQQSGVSVVPIVSKSQPAIRWKQYQARVPQLGEIDEWWGNGHPWGIALICGAVSGGLEMTELEARALDSDGLTKVANAADSLGCGDLWDRLCAGYTQHSPSGGLHLVYRIVDHEVPGNTKIAVDPEGLVRAETRGEGGYFVGAGSPGSCHPSGEPWLLLSGTYGVVPDITWIERQQLHAALALALDASFRSGPDSTSFPTDLTWSAPSTAPSDEPDHHDTTRAGSDVATLPEAVPLHPRSPEPGSGAASISPGDDFANKVDWAEILEPGGWTLSHTGAGNERFWVRPGKDKRAGHSASTDYNGGSGFFNWSTSTGFETENPLSKLFVHANISFNGDMSACASDLRRRGFGSQDLDLSKGEVDLYTRDPETETEERKHFALDEIGNGERLWHGAGRDGYRYVHEEKQIHHWSGTQWTPDHTCHLEREWIKLTEQMMKQGILDNDQALVKWAKRSRTVAQMNSAIVSMRAVEGATISASDMNTAPDHLNLLNGTYNVKTSQLEPHDREQLMTRTIKATYDPTATCPKFEAFMEQVLPDAEVRQYVQRAVGYSILGKADRRAFFLIYGPSGTGKSQFLSTMEYVLGGYAGTAAEGTFRTKDSGGPNNDLHGLRGKRFVSTSETAENTSFNENLLKRLTGTDQVVSREMYQTNVTWTPECSIWLATNHPPRFNSDDDAIWKRAKLVPFLTKFGTDVPEIPNYAREHLYAEADGILNWILAGLQDYLANGLGEPVGVRDAAEAHRAQSDSVVRFLEDQIVDGALVEGPDNTIPTRELFSMYEEWSRTSGERGLGNRRFMNRLESTGRALYCRSNGNTFWKGLHRVRRVGDWVSGNTYQDKL